ERAAVGARALGVGMGRGQDGAAKRMEAPRSVAFARPVTGLQFGEEPFGVRALDGEEVAVGNGTRCAVACEASLQYRALQRGEPLLERELLLRRLLEQPLDVRDGAVERPRHV